MKRNYASHYFETNGALSGPGVFIAVVASLIALNVGAGGTFLVISTIVAMVIVVAVFAFLLMRPTGLGRKLLDELAGFEEYPEIAEKDEMNLRNPPAKTPQLFEKYLPFALAIGVEQEWAERFSKVLAAVRASDGSATIRSGITVIGTAIAWLRPPTA